MDRGTALVVALIGAAAALGAAWISSRSPRAAAPSDVVDAAASPVPTVKSVAARPSVVVTGTRIGAAHGQRPVEQARTWFQPEETVSVTVHFTADDRVAKFPTRLSTRVMAASIGWGDRTQTQDISVPGEGLRTFQFVPERGQPWMPGIHVVSVSIDGIDMYSQQISIGSP